MQEEEPAVVGRRRGRVRPGHARGGCDVPAPHGEARRDFSLLVDGPRKLSRTRAALFGPSHVLRPPPRPLRSQARLATPPMLRLRLAVRRARDVGGRRPKRGLAGPLRRRRRRRRRRRAGAVDGGFTMRRPDSRPLPPGLASRAARRHVARRAIALPALGGVVHRGRGAFQSSGRLPAGVQRRKEEAAAPAFHPIASRGRAAPRRALNRRRGAAAGLRLFGPRLERGSAVAGSQRGLAVGARSVRVEPRRLPRVSKGSQQPGPRPPQRPRRRRRRRARPAARAGTPRRCSRAQGI
mmetsp:Transcript_7990/g.27975  ORF Transcript_7990/g.27975 Transcript_7990/m.27975 type:complete len:295 (+) Transcript_7990:731-1615(+)